MNKQNKKTVPRSQFRIPTPLAHRVAIAAARMSAKEKRKVKVGEMYEVLIELGLRSL